LAGRYRLLRRLGVGGMGEVWCARNELTRRDFALKILLATLIENTEAVQRFVREARATAKLRHPSIVEVYDAGQTADGLPFIVMELLRGESLEARIARERPLPPLTVCRLIAQTARGLAVAHAAGIVHRDLSTPNVFLAESSDGSGIVPKILDFGLIKILGPELDGRVRTTCGTIFGSPQYMSPEQVRAAETVDPRADVWSLGVLLYECLSGERPFPAKNYNALLLSIVSEPHIPLAQAAPQLDPELCDIVENCLIKERELRTNSALLVAEQLDRAALAIESRKAARRPASVQGAHPKRSKREAAPATRNARTLRIPRGAVAVFSAVLGIGLGLFLGLSRPAAPAQAAASAAKLPPITLALPNPAPAPAPTECAPAASAPAHSELVTAAARSLGVTPPPPAPPPKPKLFVYARPPRKAPNAPASVAASRVAAPRTAPKSVKVPRQLLATRTRPY
jgi:eukaryotic-like serine/threonine-protein kinase